MRLDSVYLVTDPTPNSTLADIVYETTAARLDLYVLGGGPGVWEREHHTMYATAAEANVDARARMAGREAGR